MMPVERKREVSVCELRANARTVDSDAYRSKRLLPGWSPGVIMYDDCAAKALAGRFEFMPVLRDGENLDLEMRADNDATVGPYARVHLPVSPLSVAGSSGTGSTDDSVAGSSGSVATLAVDPNDVTQIPIRAEL